MGRIILRAAGVLVLALLVYVGVDYWRDRIFWHRWVDTMTHMSPEYLNLAPLEAVPARPLPPLPSARPASTGGGQGDESGATIDAAALRDVEAYAARFDSFTLIVVHRGRVQTEWYRDDWSAERITQSQSMNKTITALLIGAAIEDGYIGSVDDPVGRYLPEWAGDPRGRITIRNLLNMSSGLAKYEFTLNPLTASSAFRFLFSAERDPIVLSTPLVWEPGSRFEYNDVNAQLAGMIVQRASGRRYAEYLSARLWGPVAGAPASVWIDRPDGMAMTACCLLAPAMTWARLGLLLKDRGMVDGRQLISSAWIDEMTAPSTRNRNYGLFVWHGAKIDASVLDIGAGLRQSEPFVADDVFFLLGLGGQRLIVSRKLDLVVVRLGPFNGYMPLKHDWDNSYIFNKVARGILSTGGPTSAQTAEAEVLTIEAAPAETGT